MPEYKTQIQADDYDLEWSRRKLHMSSDERLAEARESMAAYADFPGTDLLAVYDQATSVLPAREAKLRSAVDEGHPLTAVVQARLLTQKATVAALRGLIVERLDK